MNADSPRFFGILLVVGTVLAGAWLVSAEDVTPPIERTRPSGKFFPARAVQGPTGQLSVDSALVTLIEQVEVPAKDVGVLRTLNVAEGQMVAEGDLIAQIEDKDVELARNKSTIEAGIARHEASNDKKVRAARKAVDLAQMEVRRARESVEKYRSAIPAAELDRLQLTADRAVLDVEQAEHELETHKQTLNLKENEVALAEHNVAKRKILAPLAGIVVQVHKHAGEWVQPGDKVVRVLRLNRLRVEMFLTRQEVEAQDALVGRAVTLTTTIGGKPHDFSGKVVHVHPEINPLNGQVRIWAEVENRDLLLKPGTQGSLTVLPANPSVAKAK